MMDDVPHASSCWVNLTRNPFVPAPPMFPGALQCRSALIKIVLIVVGWILVVFLTSLRKDMDPPFSLYILW